MAHRGALSLWKIKQFACTNVQSQLAAADILLNDNSDLPMPDARIQQWLGTSLVQDVEAMVAADGAGDTANAHLAEIASSIDSAEVASAIAVMEPAANTARNAIPAAESQGALALLEPSLAGAATGAADSPRATPAADLAKIASSIDSAEVASAIAVMEPAANTARNAIPAAESQGALALLEPSLAGACRQPVRHSRRRSSRNRQLHRLR